MKSSVHHLSIENQFIHLFNLISSERFIQMRGLGNEVPFFICPYNPKDFFEYEQGIERFLVKPLQVQKSIRVKTINLYDLSIEFIKSEGYWDEIIGNEQDIEKESLLSALQNLLDPEDSLVPLIAEKIKDPGSYDVLFLTGVGQVFPYIRSHTVLENLQRTAKAHPTVIFFPGEYTKSSTGGTSLDLFGLLHDNKYYRAFNIFDCEA